MMVAYEVASGDRISDAVRVPTIMDHAPEFVKATHCQSPLGQRRSVDPLTLWIREASYVDRRLDELALLHMARNWIGGRVLSTVEVSFCAGAAHDAERHGRSQWAANEINWLPRWQNDVSRRKLNVKFTISRTHFHSRGVDH